MSSGERKWIAVVGPTAVGKTRLSLELAQRIQAEIISVDSRQVYRYMDIGTAKPTAQERASVRHHLIDVVDPDQKYNAGRYGQDARQAVEEVFSRRNVPIVVGGSGLYLRAMVDGIFPGRSSDPEVRAALRDRLKAEGSPALHRALMRVDPEAGSRIHPNDVQRIVRALEVFRVTGQRISELQEASNGKSLRGTLFLYGLCMDRVSLYRRIEERVDRMIRDGLVEEVTSLPEMGYDKNLLPLQTFGYREVISFLEGTIPWEEATSLIKTSTRRYAKRQMTWFRANPRVRWLETERRVDALAEEIIRRFESEDG